MQNINTEELNQFNQHANAWWDERGEFKTLHALNPLRVGFIEKYVSLQGKNILDVGCGGGILTESLAKKGAHMTGIDMADAVLNVAREHAQTVNLSIDYQLITIEELAETAPPLFDAITCMEMLEHVPDPEKIIESIAKLVKPNGFVFLSTLNRNLKSYLGAIVGAEYLFKILPKGTHHYESFIRPSELLKLCRHHGFKLVEMAGIHYNPLTDHFKLNDNLDINYMVALQKI